MSWGKISLKFLGKDALSRLDPIDDTFTKAIRMLVAPPVVFTVSGAHGLIEAGSPLLKKAKV